MSGLKREYEVIMCECQCEVPIEFAHINEDGNWTCANCLIDELTEKKANEANKPDAAALPIESVMPRFLGIATKLSPMAKRNLPEHEIEDIEQHLPCEAFESDEKSNVDNTYLVKFEGMTQREEYIHKDMLIINGA
ncbi:MAG: hypothetical protein ACXAC7_12330 [Candidatus Hodarchaeales archaeon]|jgi:hypothetical protein